MTSHHRADLEHNPWVLVAAFIGVAAVLFGVLRLTAPDAQKQAADTTPQPTASTSASALTTTTRAPIQAKKLSAATLRKQLAAKLRRKVARNRPEVTTTGPLGTLTAPAGKPVDGSITTAVANIPNRTSNGGWAVSMRTLTGAHPDFITLNEVSRHSTAGIDAAAPGYTAYRDETPDHSRGAGGQVMNNVVLWRHDVWDQVGGGRVRVVDDDRGILHGHAFVWDRFATWALLERKSDGAVASIISVHMPTNPARTATRGLSAGARAAKYGHGMDVLIGMVHQLQQYGPVLVGGDMNSHPGQGGWTAAAKMNAAGFTYAKDSGVIYLFYRSPASLVARRQVHVVSDHPALITTLSMNGSGPA